MGSSPLSLKRALLLGAFFALGVVAQNDNEDDQPRPAPTTERENDPAPTTTNPRPNPPTQATTTTDRAAAPTTQTTSERQTSTSAASSSTARDPLTLPPLSSTTSSISRGPLTGMPTLPSTADPAVNTYPPPTIPPTRNAPFMNHSTLPDGTVFIAVGAILGAFGVAILLWRAIVACLLHRSVERAALAQHAANNGRGPGDKNAASFPAPPAQFYKYIERESSASLAGAGVGGASGRRTHRGPTPSATPSQTNLFFSPTAVGSSSGLGNAANRDSGRFLPSGFYAASAAPNPAVHHAQGNSISLSTLRPTSQVGPRGGVPLGHSPPESPDVGPRGGVSSSRNFSTSSLNLNNMNRPPSAGTRAPSAYLDDLLDEQPGLFPPAAAGAGPGPGVGPQGAQGYGQGYGQPGHSHGNSYGGQGSQRGRY